MKDILVGSIMGSAIAEIATLPICTTKTIYQANPKSVSILTVAKNIYQKGGFYKGALPAFWAQIFSSSSKIVLYNFFINNWHPQLDTYHFKYICLRYIISRFDHVYNSPTRCLQDFTSKFY